MKKTAWAYYSSGADDEIVCVSLQMNGLVLTSLDNARKPLGISQNMVST
jgi:hypothetical protein